MLNKFIISLLIQALQDERVREFVADQVARLADHLKDELLPDIVSTFPVFAASVAKTVLNLPAEIGDIAKGSAESIIKSDPDLPIISEFLDISEALRKWLKL